MNKNTEIVKQFISTIIPDIKHPNFNCSWDIKQSWYMIDDWLAYAYNSNLKWFLKPEKFSFKLYWWVYDKIIQTLDIHKYAMYLLSIDSKDANSEENELSINSKVDELNLQVQTKDLSNTTLIEATSVFSQHIWIYLKWNIIWDDFFQLIMQVLEYVDVFEININDVSHFVFVSKQQIQVKQTVIDVSTTSSTQSTQPTTWTISKAKWKKKPITWVFNILLHKPANELSNTEFRYNNIMLLIKEAKDWYFDCRTHSLALKNKRNVYELHEYLIWEDIDIIINTKTNEVLQVDTRETIYRSYKDDTWVWSIQEKDKPSTKIKVSQFKNIITTLDSTNPDIQHIQLRWAYTHVLRNILWFKPQTWQYKCLINQMRINYVAWVRRWGKTLLSSYLIIRFLYRNPTDLKHTLRQPKWIYTITSKDKFKAVLDYIEAQSNRIKVLKSLIYIKRQDRLILSDDKIDFWKTKYQEIQSTYDFISSKWYKTWVWNGWDDIILDESSTISEDVWLNLAPIVTNEWANLFCISTIDWLTPKQWFYTNLVNVERWVIQNAYSQRVTIDDIDSNIMDKEAKEYAKSTLIHNMPRYLWELYATFSSESQVFSSEGSVVLDLPVQPHKFEEIILWYDPAKRSDYGAIVVVWVFESKLYAIEEFQLQWDYSTYQKTVLFDLKRKYLDYWIKTTLIMDWTSAWDVVAEILWNIVDFKVWYTWDNSSSYKPHVDDFWSWKVSKTRLVTTTQMLFETKRIKIFSNLVKLQGEITTFKQYLSNWKTKYDAISWEHDDLVNWLMLISFFYWYIQWNLSGLTKSNDLELQTLNRQHMNSKTGLYKEYFKTVKSAADRNRINSSWNTKRKTSWYKC